MRLPKIVRFGLAGLAGLTLDFALLIAFYNAGVPLAIATAAAFLIQGCAHYALTRLWVFPHPTGSTSELGKLGRYFALLAINCAVTAAAVPALTWLGLDYRLAKAVTVVALFVANYYLMPRVVMRLYAREPVPAPVP